MLRLQSITTGQFLWEDDKLICFMPYWPDNYKQPLLLKAADPKHVEEHYKYYIFGEHFVCEFGPPEDKEILKMTKQEHEDMFGPITKY